MFFLLSNLGHNKRSFSACRRRNKFVRRRAALVAFAIMAIASLVLSGSSFWPTVDASSSIKSALLRHSLAPDDGSPAQSAELQNRTVTDLSKMLKRYDLLKLSRRAAVSQIRKHGTLLLKTSRGDFDLKLVPNDLRSSDYRSQVIGSSGIALELPSAPVNTFKGIVKGNSTAQVRMTVTDSSVEGSIITESERYFFQPARPLSKSATEDEFVFYNAEDLTSEGATCGVTLADEVAAQEERVKDLAL
ncbi:MAG TPA: hypothetical protein VJS64_10930, partial [Pyrinomonadaceae bacterium]|nr:hypothetical protein [Pyrinomonadaceae bacterium]